MIPHINNLLNRWAEWVLLGRKVRGLGYPTRSAFMRLTPSGGGGDVMFDEEAFRVDRAVQALEVEFADLHGVVMMFHLRGRSMTVAQMAREARCCRDTLYARLDLAQRKVMDYLQDIELGVELPTKKVEIAA